MNGFNGAAPERARRHIIAGTGAGALGWLQWGRTPEGAEIRVVGHNRHDVMELQWGRAPEGAEM